MYVYNKSENHICFLNNLAIQDPQWSSNVLYIIIQSYYILYILLYFIYSQRTLNYDKTTFSYGVLFKLKNPYICAIFYSKTKDVSL